MRPESYIYHSLTMNLFSFNLFKEYNPKWNLPHNKQSFEGIHCGIQIKNSNPRPDLHVDHPKEQIHLEHNSHTHCKLI